MKLDRSARRISSKKFAWLSSAIVLLAFAVTLMARFWSPEPQYEGKTVSEWFAAIHVVSIGKSSNAAFLDDNDPALQALVAIGESPTSYLIEHYHATTNTNLSNADTTRERIALILEKIDFRLAAEFKTRLFAH